MRRREAGPAGDAIRRMLEWYESRERNVPGRGETDPYRIWVAEVMAQQTRVATVATRYLEFIERFPDVEALAAADVDQVLKAWEGLGYYGRARNLHRAAHEVSVRYGGRLPPDPDRLRSLPGIGRYTAGALASIAFGLPEPAVDGNVRRVLSRAYDLERPTARELDRRARELIRLAGGDAASVNQALMDLGASICLPRRPRCPQCPLEGTCLARRRNTIESRPARRSRTAVPHYDVGAAIVWWDGMLLVARRRDDRMLGGLWEFPGGKVEAGETAAAAACREVREETGLEIELCGLAARIGHAYSHFRITLHLFHARAVRRAHALAPDGCRWVRPDDLPSLAFPAANHAIVGRLAAGLEIAPPGCS